MKAHIRQYNEAAKQYLHTFIEFPPSQKSKICAAPGAQCDRVTWSVRTGIGKYFVRLYVGDPQNNSKVDFEMNGVWLARNKIVKKGKLKIFEGVVEAKNEFLVLKDKCETNCSFSSAKLNAIEVSPYEEKKKLEAPVTLESPTTCGHAFNGGRCESGPDVLHCLFEDPSREVAGNCTGSLVIMAIPKTYHCKDQVGKYKCLKKVYANNDECQKYCVNDCKRNQCIG
jgi:hypothetical protein